MTGKQRILFLCTANSARSQMAEAILRRLGGNRFEVFSAGTEATRVNSLAVRAMEEAGFDMSGQYSKNLNYFLGQPFDYVITLCSDAEERCPFFPGRVQRLHWPFDDPAAAQGTEAERVMAFRLVRDAINAKISQWLVDQ